MGVEHQKVDERLQEGIAFSKSRKEPIVTSLVLAFLSLLQNREQAVTRKYCLTEFSEETRLEGGTERFSGFLPGGKYCLTLNNPRTGFFTLSGTGRKGTWSRTYTEPRHDPHDPQRMLPKTTSDTDWVMEPERLHGSFVIDGSTLHL